jgi:hypothetical protein
MVHARVSANDAAAGKNCDFLFLPEREKPFLYFLATRGNSFKLLQNL